MGKYLVKVFFYQTCFAILHSIFNCKYEKDSFSYLPLKMLCNFSKASLVKNKHLLPKIHPVCH